VYEGVRRGRLWSIGQAEGHQVTVELHSRSRTGQGEVEVEVRVGSGISTRYVLGSS
jgi:hypothetical protein